MRASTVRALRARPAPCAVQAFLPAAETLARGHSLAPRFIQIGAPIRPRPDGADAVAAALILEGYLTFKRSRG